MLRIKLLSSGSSPRKRGPPDLRLQWARWCTSSRRLPKQRLGSPEQTGSDRERSQSSNVGNPIKNLPFVDAFLLDLGLPHCNSVLNLPEPMYWLWETLSVKKKLSTWGGGFGMPHLRPSRRSCLPAAGRSHAVSKQLGCGNFLLAIAYV